MLTLSFSIKSLVYSSPGWLDIPLFSLYESKLSVLLLYLSVMLLMFNLNSLFLFWLLLELNLVSFIIIFIYSDKVGNSQLLFYFMIQSILSLIFLFFLNKLFFSSLFFTSTMIQLLFLFKMGVFPFHFWIFNISSYISLFNLFLIMTFQKIPSYLILFMWNSNSYVVLVLLMSLLMGLLFMYNSTDLIYLLIASSIYSNLWFCFIFYCDTYLFFLSFILYSFTLAFFLNSLNKSSNSPLYYTMGALYLIGLPPINLFFFKFFSMDLIISMLGYSMVLFIWLSTFLGVVFYFKFFFHSFSFSFFSLNINSPFKIGNYNFFFFFITFIIFLF